MKAEIRKLHFKRWQLTRSVAVLSWTTDSLADYGFGSTVNPEARFSCREYIVRFFQSATIASK